MLYSSSISLASFSSKVVSDSEPEDENEVFPHVTYTQKCCKHQLTAKMHRYCNIVCITNSLRICCDIPEVFAILTTLAK